MSLVNSDLFSVVKKQYLYKLKGCSKFFYIIIATQIIGMLFTLTNAGGNMATSNGLYSFNISINSTLQVFIFTAACIMGATISLNGRENKDMDFTLISNGLSSNLSNMLFIITLSFFGAVTSALSGPFIRGIKYVLIGSSKIIKEGFIVTTGEVILTIFASFLYILLISSLVYLFTVITIRVKAFLIVILAMVVLLPQTPIFMDIVKFYGSGNTLLMFTVKVLVSYVIFSAGSLLISNNMEVGR